MGEGEGGGDKKLFSPSPFVQMKFAPVTVIFGGDKKLFSPSPFVPSFDGRGDFRIPRSLLREGSLKNFNNDNICDIFKDRKK